MKNRLLTFIAMLFASVYSYTVQAEETGLVTSADELATGDVILIKQTTSDFYIGSVNISSNNSNAALMPYSLYDEHIQLVVTQGGSAGEYNFHVKSTDAGTKFYLHATTANAWTTQIGEYASGGLSTWILSFDSDGICQIRNSQTTGAYLGSNTTTVTSALYRDKTNANTYWKIYKVAELQNEFLQSLDNATPTNPVNATPFISNPIIAASGTPIQGWSTIQGAGNNGPLLGSGDASLEAWASAAANLSFNYSQTLKNLPNGIYQLTGQCYNSINGEAKGSTPNGNGGIYGIAGGEEQLAGVTVDGETLQDYTLNNLIVTDGTLTIGVKTKDVMTARWFVADNFSLNYLGFDPTSMINALNLQITYAKSLDTSHATLTVGQALQTAITTAEEVILTALKEELENAASLLSAAIRTTETSIQEYADITAAIAEAKALYTHNYQGLAAYQTTVETIEVTLTDQTFVKDQALADLREAIKTYVLSQQPTASESNPVDFTLLIENNSFETGTTDGWILNGTSSDTGVKPNSNGTYTINNADGNYIFNTYSVGYGISQKLTEVPNGVYEMSVLIAHDAGNKTIIFANETEETITHVGNKATGEVATLKVLVTNNTLSLGTKDGPSWYKADHFTLAYQGIDLTAFKEGLDTQLKAAKAFSAKIKNEYIADIETNTTIVDFNTAISTAQGIYDNSESSDEMISATEELKSKTTTTRNFLVSYAKDISVAILNNDFSNTTSDWDVVGKSSIKSNEHYTGAVNPYFDSNHWEETGWNLTASQDIAYLKKGMYCLSFATRASANINLSVSATSSVETSTVTVTPVGNQGGTLGKGWSTYSTFVLVGEDGALNIGMNASTDLIHEWMSIDDFTLAKVGTMAVYTRDGATTVSGVLEDAVVAELNASTTLTSVDLSGATSEGATTLTLMNPNAIVYGLPAHATLTNGIDANGGTAMLNEDFAFNAPAGFNAQVSFERSTFNGTVNHTVLGGWQTLCLPFDVDMQEITCSDGAGNLIPVKNFTGKESGLRPFWLYRADETAELGFESATTILANVPYLVLFPNDDSAEGYEDYFNIHGTITFTGTAVAKTEVKSENAGSNYFLNSNFAPLTDAAKYGLDADGANFVSGATVNAFSAYASQPTSTGAKVLPIFGGTTGLPEGITLDNQKNLLVYAAGNGVVGILSPKACKVAVYTLDGTPFGTYDVAEGTNEISLPAHENGTYIINGQVVIVY